MKNQVGNAPTPTTFRDQELLRSILSVSNDEACATLQTSLSGLTAEEAAKRLGTYGHNALSTDKPKPWHSFLAQSFIDPFVGVLVLLALVSLITDVLLADAHAKSFATVTILLVLIVQSGLMRFWQEFRSNQASLRLKQMVQNQATVLRPGQTPDQTPGQPSNQSGPASGQTTEQYPDHYTVELPIKKLVPGDVLRLSAGDMVPADVRLLETKDFFIAQGMLTGESMPVEKHAVTLPADTAPIESDNLCFMGSSVVSGSAKAVVVSTGQRTYIGCMAKAITGDETYTAFDRGVKRVSLLFIRCMCVLAPLIFLINGFTKGNWLDAFLLSISVAAGLTPCMLPTVVSSNLARGAMRMAKRKTIVKRLNSIQNFGAMDVLCTDKTGTLTQNKIILERHLDSLGNNSELVLDLAFLNSFHQTGLKNLLDRMIVEHSDLDGRKDSLVRWQKIDEVPFDFTRRKMSVVVRDVEKDKNLLICKGAIEEILKSCTSIDQDSATLPIDPMLHDEIIQVTGRLNRDGLRTIAVAYKEVADDKHAFGIADESGLTMAGYICFLDPPKESAAPAVAFLQKKGVAVKVLTGDNLAVTLKICRDIGLQVQDSTSGPELERLSPDEFSLQVEKCTVLAKLSPLQKSQIIRSLRQNGHTVGFLGDGINDAPALKEADVGISVDTATDIAKESADIILLEHSLSVLAEGLVEGRTTFGNIMKYIKMAASSNFGGVFSMLVASSFLPFLPMMPIQLLTQNLLYDVSQLAIPWDHVDEEFIAKPHKWAASDIWRFMTWIGPVSSIFDFMTFYLLWHVFGANSEAGQALFQSGWFVESMITQLLIIHVIRTQKIPFLQSRSSLALTLTTTIIIAIALALPFSGIGAGMGMTALPWQFFPYLAGITVGYCVLAQVIKGLYLRTFKVWL